MSKIVALCLLCLSSSVWAQTRPYRKATEGQAVVMRKLYPKKRKVEFSFNSGALVNQSYIETVMFSTGMSYHFNEHWGITSEWSYGLSFDKSDRFCLEHFVNKSTQAETTFAGFECFYDEASLKDPRDPTGKKDSETVKKMKTVGRDIINLGPAYVPIVQIKQLAMGGVVWTPIYGKQIFTFLPRTSHMDFYLLGLGGVAIGDFFRQQTTLANENKSRFSEQNKDKIPSGVGTALDEVESYGAKGRPEAQKFYSPAVAIGIGQKYHLARWLFLRIEARNYAVFAVQDVFFHSVFAVRGGLGVIL